jgi:hypothetical protein
MSDSDRTEDAGIPQTPGLAEAMTKLRAATEMLRQLNEETPASSPAPAPGAPAKASEEP